MITSPLTQEFDALVAELGYLHQYVQEDGTRVITDNENGFILEGEAGSWTLTEKSRNINSFVMSVSEIIDIERYLTHFYGRSLRGVRGLPPIMGAGVTPAKLAPTFSLVEVTSDKVALLRQDGSTRAVLYGDTGTCADLAVRFSWIADVSLEDLRASLRDPDGLPLLPGLTIYQPSRVLGQKDTG